MEILTVAVALLACMLISFGLAKAALASVLSVMGVNGKEDSNARREIAASEIPDADSSLTRSSSG